MSVGADAMNAYLNGLPRGLDSYPECQVKGSVVRAFFDELPTERFTDELPPALTALFESPPLPSSWVPEAHFSAMIAFVAAQVYPNEDAFVSGAYRSNIALLDSFAYRILFRLVGPTRLMQQAAARWQLFHRGTELLITEQARAQLGGALLLKSPPRHVPWPLARAYSTAFRAALEIGGCKNVRFDVSQRDPSTLEYRGRWE